MNLAHVPLVLFFIAFVYSIGWTFAASERPKKVAQVVEAQGDTRMGAPAPQELRLEAMSVEELDAVQTALNSRGYSVDTRSSIEQTRRAIKYFQLDIGMAATGRMNTATLNALGLTYADEFERLPAAQMED